MYLLITKSRPAVTVLCHPNLRDWNIPSSVKPLVRPCPLGLHSVTLTLGMVAELGVCMGNVNSTKVNEAGFFLFFITSFLRFCLLCQVYCPYAS